MSSITKPSSLPSLLLQPDEGKGRYQIWTLDQAGSASIVSLGAWQPAGLPSELFTNTGAKAGSDVQHGSKTDKRKLMARDAAWAKKSGRDLVVRQLKHNDRPEPSFTDIHFSPPGLEEQDFADFPISELPNSPLSELSASGSRHACPYYGRHELPLHPVALGLDCHEIPDELPTIHQLHEVDAPALSPQVLHQPLAREFSFVASSSAEDVHSPDGSCKRLSAIAILLSSILSETAVIVSLRQSYPADDKFQLDIETPGSRIYRH